MITKWLLISFLIGVSSYCIIQFVLPKERVEIDEKTSYKKSPWYINRNPFSFYETHKKDYIYFGETIDIHGDTKYVYKKYCTNYKFDNVNWELMKTRLLVANIALIGMLITSMFIFSVSSYNHSNRLNVLEHQRNYVEELNKEVDIIVKSFMEHEEITFDRDISLEALVITYPELRSVELVTNQLETLKYEKQKLNEIEISLIKYETIKKWFWF